MPVLLGVVERQEPELNFMATYGCYHISQHGKWVGNSSRVHSAPASMKYEWETKSRPQAPASRDDCRKIDSCNPALPSRNAAKASQRHHLFVAECVNLSISEFVSYETTSISAAACAVRGAAWGAAGRLIPGHAKCLLTPTQNAAASRNHYKAPGSPGAFTKLFQQTHQSSAWKSNNCLMSRFPTLCIRHFQCHFPPN